VAVGTASQAMTQLTKEERSRFIRRPVKCPMLDARVRNLADYITLISGSGMLWYRGHGNVSWRLAPSALRYSGATQRLAALGLLAPFKRICEMKLSRPPSQTEELRWVQLAQHYGLPTRLLDWTESAVVALYFACLSPEHDGYVFMMNPVDLNRASSPRRPRVLDVNSDSDLIAKYLHNSSSRKRQRLRTVAISPVWNSERLVAQKGVFTLHGTDIDLDQEQVPSLVCLPILKEAKNTLQGDLERIGIDEMSMFPELEYACRFLKRRAKLC
jgi:hypothetical protein